ncbi:BTB/POZ and MATH domain-containing protein 2-like [Panicum virgatum]|uniref:BTB/POZ and MATH domain-containing protein 2-like n=1 Tax=Panicum virgatum TaxID=38727 RepID=UPI0019D5B3CF|nr:BTB/POZ and MATH domain-containing protein 2-like [Panicum virgatum]
MAMSSFAGVSVVGGGGSPPQDASATMPVKYSGYHLLVVNGYSRIKDRPNGSKCIIASRHFRVGGYRWVIECYPNGYESGHDGKLTFYLVLGQGNVVDPVMAQYEFSFVVDQAHNSDSPQPQLAPASANRTELDIEQDISGLLKSGVGADVTFQVGNAKFAAHRCVLAARSAVFKAQLFGPMKEGTSTSVIHVNDMEEQVFKHLLDFINSDSVPELETEEEDVMWQHLLVAADRYDLPRLRLICEQELCDSSINTSTVANILALAEEHHCLELKEDCLNFLDCPAHLQDVMAAGGLEQLGSSCPSALIDLIAKLASLKHDN